MTTCDPRCVTEERETHKAPYRGSVVCYQKQVNQGEGGCVLGNSVVIVMEGNKGTAERICLFHAVRITTDIK